MKIGKCKVDLSWKVFGLRVREAFLAIWWTFLEFASLIYSKHKFENGDRMIVIGPLRIEWTP